MSVETILSSVGHEKPILIAGATASGKSSLALTLAQQRGGVIVNADALQVYAGWRILTARPSIAEEQLAPHALYGHIPNKTPYSVGDWLREICTRIKGGQRLIIVGGTGLYFRALTEGLAEIPPIPDHVRTEANAFLAAHGLSSMVSCLDAETIARIDTNNPMRVQRAWEVQTATGKSISDWQDTTPPPLMPLSEVSAIHLSAPVEWLNDRISRRFDIMLDQGAMTEAKENLSEWDPALQSSQAIGAPELIAHLQGDITLEQARERAIIASRQYAKRQRTWFRKRMANWNTLEADKI